MARVGFWDLFQSYPDGSISPKRPVRIAGVVLDPNTRYSRGILFSGWDLFQYYGRDLELEEQQDNNPPIVTRIY